MLSCLQFVVPSTSSGFAAPSRRVAKSVRERELGGCCAIESFGDFFSVGDLLFFFLSVGLEK